MLRATQTEGKEGVTLMLEGKLSGPWVDEVQKCWAEHAVPGRQAPIRVNLREVSYVDGRGRDLLIRMEREGASLVEASAFIRHLLSENVSSEAKDMLRPHRRDTNGAKKERGGSHERTVRTRNRR